MMAGLEKNRAAKVAVFILFGTFHPKFRFHKPEVFLQSRIYHLQKSTGGTVLIILRSVLGNFAPPLLTFSAKLCYHVDAFRRI